MCVIAVSEKGIRQPTEKELSLMWKGNPDGGGYMCIRNGKVMIHKGFLEWKDFIRSVRSEKFTPDDPVVYHFRIATQGGINAEMTHPFPLSNDIHHMSALDVSCEIGVAHNGIIPLTADKNNKDFSDTALFVTQYLSALVRSPFDLLNPHILTMIERLGNSKFALMDRYGNITTIGKFETENGILVSNRYYLIMEQFRKGGEKDVLRFQGQSFRYGF